MAFEATYTTEYGSSQSTTKLKSSIEIVDSEGNTIKPLQNKGTYYYSYVPAKSKVNYEIKTFSKDKAISDEVQIKIITQDREYMHQMMNETLKAGSESQRQQWETQLMNGDTQEFTTAVASVVDKSKQFKELYSKTMNTESNGIKKGYITIPEDIQGYFSIIISYGYSQKGRDYSIWEAYAPSIDQVMLVLDILTVVMLVVSLGTATPLAAGLTALRKTGTTVGKKAAKELGEQGAKTALRKLSNRALIATESATFGIMMITSNNLGAVTTNADGADFGGGHVHAYGALATDLDPNKIEFREEELENLYYQEILERGTPIALAVIGILLIPKIIAKKRERGESDD